jgi:hypothetical protein
MKRLFQPIRRRFDQLVDRALVRGSFLAVALLLAGSFLIVFVGALIVAIGHINLENEEDSVIEVAWQVLLRAMSPDQLMDNTRWDARVVLLVVTIVGLLLVSTLISILNSVIERRMEFIHRGRGFVSIKNHLVILNWNQFGIRVVREVAQSAEPGHAPCRIAILCDLDPVDLMHEIRDSLLDDVGADTSRIHRHYLHHPENWIVIRRGNSTNTADLSHLTSVATARSVIVLRDTTAEAAQILRVVLAIDSVLSMETTSSEQYGQLPVVTFTKRNFLADQLDRRLSNAASIGIPTCRTVNYIPLNAEDVRHGVETQVSRHRGLSAVYQDLLNFGGQELYMVDPPSYPTTFGEILMGSSEVTPIGLLDDGGLDLWPEWDKDITHSRILALSENRMAASRWSKTSYHDAVRGPRNSPDSKNESVEQFLFIGWNDGSARLASALESILPTGSSLTVVRRTLDRLDIPNRFCSTDVRVVSADNSDPISAPGFLDEFEHVIVFTDESVDPGTSDTEVLIDLLSCRHHANSITDPSRRFTIVAELQKRSSRYIAGDRLADDLLINDALLASAAVQLAFAPELEAVFTELLSEKNPVELITRHISQWSENVIGNSWDRLIKATCEGTGEIPLGYRRVIAGTPEVVLNPPRDAICEDQDEIVVLSRRAERQS